MHTRRVTRKMISVLVLSAGSLAAMEMQILEPPAGTSSFGRILSLSTDGSKMAGEAVALVGWEREAVIWKAAGGMSLAAVSADDPAAELASGISDDGTVVAGWHFASRSTGFVTVEGGTAPSLSNNLDYRIHALTPDGTSAAGCDAVSSNSFDFSAAIWDLGSGARTAVADLPGGATDAAFLAISADGQTCVGYGEDASGRLAVRSVAGGTLSQLGDLSGGQVFSEARGVSADGNVIVGRSRSTDGMEAFRWTSEGISGLGDLPGGAFVSEACSVSADGAVIAGVAESELGSEVFLWTEERGMRSLRTVAAIGGLDLSGWHFSGAWPVLSGDGDVIGVNAIDPWQAPRFLRISGLSDAVNAANLKPAPVCGFVGEGFGIRFTAEPGIRYQLQCSETLDADDWTDVGTVVTGDGTEVELVVPVEAKACFFRLMLLP